MKTPQPTIWQRALCVLVGLAAGFCLVFSSAEAAIVQPSGEPESIREVPIPRGLDKVATEFWAYRGVTVPPNVRLIEMVPEALIAARGWGPPDHPPTIWIAPEYLYHYDLRRLCMIYIHERGHTAGLEHDSPFWIMWPGQPWEHSIPPRCEKWGWI